MSSKDANGIKHSAEEASLHTNDSDRSTWNKLCVANKELRDAGRTMTPPWPESIVQQVSLARAMAFSPCGDYLACAIASGEGRPPFVEILDRRNGQQTSLRGHLDDIFCLAFSGDGKYLASGGNETLIRIWPTNSTRKPTQQSRNKTLPGHPTGTVQSLAFASDSNILASGSDGEIKLWNVEDGVCIHRFHHQYGDICSSLVFLGVGESIRCLAATNDGSLIRISRNSSHDSEFTSDVVFDRATRFFCTTFSPCGSFLATVDSTNKLCLYEIEMEGMNMVQIAILPIHINAAISFSADSRTLAVVNDTFGDYDTFGRLLDVKDFTLQRQLKWPSRGSFPVSLAVDPSNRYLAISFSDGRVRLWTV